VRNLIDDIPEDMENFMSNLGSQVTNNTEQIMVPHWVPNIKKNIEYFGDRIKENSLKLLKCKYDGSVFLVGAGPSLKQNIEELKTKKGIKIVCSHALKFCLDNGLIPDYVVVVDAKTDVIKHLDVKVKGLKLICDIGVNHEALKKWHEDGNSIYWFRMSTFPQVDEIVDSLIDFKYEVTAGGSVMSFATVISQGMGFKKVFFIGVDLTSMIYADGSVMGNEDSKDFLDTCDIHGIHAVTWVQFYIYKHFIEKFTKLFKDIEWFNAAGQGILGAYVQGNVSWIKQINLNEIG
jgi:hypothetical protein